MKPPRNDRPPRRGFTLVELLVVITIIGILAAILVPTLSGIFRTTEEFTINNEIQQLDAAVENFKTEFGFYPPDMTEFIDGKGQPLNFTDATRLGPTVQQRWLSLLAKIAPTHRENEPVGSTTRLEMWWNTVGQQLVMADTGTDNFGNTYRVARGPRVALWYWLSRLYNDASYPLTGNPNDAPGVGNPDRRERKVFFDFAGSQQDRVTAPVDFNSEVEVEILQYLQKGGAALPYVYFHNATYQFGGNKPFQEILNFPDVRVAGDQYANLVRACEIPSSSGQLLTGNYFNPNTFQILAPGSDESFGSGAPLNQLASPNAYADRDNICNFAEGRLDVFVDRETN